MIGMQQGMLGRPGEVAAEQSSTLQPKDASCAAAGTAEGRPDAPSINIPKAALALIVPPQPGLTGSCRSGYD